MHHYLFSFTALILNSSNFSTSILVFITCTVYILLLVDCNTAEAPLQQSPSLLRFVHLRPINQKRNLEIPLYETEALILDVSVHPSFIHFTKTKPDSICATMYSQVYVIQVKGHSHLSSRDQEVYKYYFKGTVENSSENIGKEWPSHFLNDYAYEGPSLLLFHFSGESILDTSTLEVHMYNKRKLARSKHILHS